MTRMFLEGLEQDLHDETHAIGSWMFLAVKNAESGGFCRLSINLSLLLVLLRWLPMNWAWRGLLSEIPKKGVAFNLAIIFAK